MSKTVIASLIKISNDLDGLSLLEFADEVDSVIRLINASSENDMVDQKQLEYNELINETLPESEDEIKENKENLNAVQQQYIPNALLALQEALKAKKAREQNIQPEETGEIFTTPLDQSNRYQVVT